MFLLNVLLLGIALYFAREEYNKDRTGMAMFWSMLIGWDLHVLITS
jgi:hypothetical protein